MYYIRRCCSGSFNFPLVLEIFQTILISQCKNNIYLIIYYKKGMEKYSQIVLYLITSLSVFLAIQVLFLRISPAVAFVTSSHYNYLSLLHLKC